MDLNSEFRAAQGAEGVGGCTRAHAHAHTQHTHTHIHIHTHTLMRMLLDVIYMFDVYS